MNILPMICKDINIDFKIGIHSRPAAMLVKKVREYPGVTVKFGKEGKFAPGNSLIGLLQLGITGGSVMSIQVDGENEENVITEIIDFINNKVAPEG